MRLYFVYILSSYSRTLYTGVTNDLRRRMLEHKAGAVPGFTKKYRVNRLVHVEEYTEVTMAIAREKQIKGWLRSKKIALIERFNPEWRDLAESLDPPPGPSAAERPQDDNRGD